MHLVEKVPGEHGVACVFEVTVRHRFSVTRPAVSKHQEAVLLGVHVNTVKHLIKTGILPATKVGRAWRIKKADVLAYVDAGADRGATMSKALFLRPD